MSCGGGKHIYGPVPSRRLGRSLGIDLVPFKTCTYDCIYCQLGRTTDKTIERKDYFNVNEVLAELKRRLVDGLKPDYISLAGSGEPTLNRRIGDLISKIKKITNIPLAVLTNGSLLWMPEVQDALMEANLVLPSLDAGDERLFRYINRPQPQIHFTQMLEGLSEFTHRFAGEVWLEVFLLAGVTGIASEAEKIAAQSRQIKPARIQLNTISRPPAEAFAYAVTVEQMLSLKALFPGKTDIISRKEGDSSYDSEFSRAKVDDIMALLSRRPCTAEDVAAGLGIHLNDSIKRLEKLIASGKVNTVFTGGRNYYQVIHRNEVLSASEKVPLV